MLVPVLESKLADFLKSGKDWERKPTTVPGVFVLKLPPFRGSPTRLAVELNPVDEAGRPTRKRGVLVRSSEELEAGATIFLHSLPKLATALEEEGFDPLSLDGLIASSRTKIEQATKPLPKQLQVANQRWDTVPKMFFGGSRLQLDRLVHSGADIVTSPEPSWRALYYQYLVPKNQVKEIGVSTVRVESRKSLKDIVCDCPVCGSDLLAKSFSERPKTQFVNLLTIHNNNIMWRKVEQLRCGGHQGSRQAEAT